MTTKERLYKELISVKNEINTVKGESEKNINLDEYVNSWEFQRIASTRKVFELENQLEGAKKEIERAKKEVARQAWFETEEGKAFKEANDKARKENWEAQVALRKEAEDYARSQVRAILGNDFDITSFGFGCFEVVLVKEYREDGTPVGHFGHEFNVYFENDWFKKGFKWELNYGCLGSFELGQDVNRTKFLTGLATFAGSSVVSGGFKEKMKEYTDKNDALRMEGYRLQEEAKNPKELAA